MKRSVKALCIFAQKGSGISGTKISRRPLAVIYQRRDAQKNNNNFITEWMLRCCKTCFCLEVSELFLIFLLLLFSFFFFFNNTITL